MHLFHDDNWFSFKVLFLLLRRQVNIKLIPVTFLCRFRLLDILHARKSLIECLLHFIFAFINTHSSIEGLRQFFEFFLGQGCWLILINQAIKLILILAKLLKALQFRLINYFTLLESLDYLLFDHWRQMVMIQIIEVKVNGERKLIGALASSLD